LEIFAREAAERLANRDSKFWRRSCEQLGVSGNRLTLNEFRASVPGVPLDTVFRALDGRDLDVDGDACHVAVCGIYDAGGQRWVQLALAGSRPLMLTIRLGVEPLDVVSKFS